MKNSIILRISEIDLGKRKTKSEVPKNIYRVLGKVAKFDKL